MQLFIRSDSVATFSSVDYFYSVVNSINLRRKNYVKFNVFHTAHFVLVLEELMLVARSHCIEPEGDSVRHKANQFDQIGWGTALQ